MRISSLIQAITRDSQLTVVYLGLPHNKDDAAVISSEFNCRVVFLQKEKECTKSQYSKLLKKWLRSESVDICIVEFIHISYFLDCLPENTLKILDVHDIIYERSNEFRQFNYDKETIPLQREVESAIFQLYDHIIAICAPDYQKLLEDIPQARLLLCPHPAEPTQKDNRPQARTIGFIASSYLPNKDAIGMFLRDCWPAISERYNVSLNIYGNIVHHLEKSLCPSTVCLKGFVKDTATIYQECDIMINPVRFGSGIKIKNVEAMSYGLPLITTTHGSRGLGDAKQKAFLVADDPVDFIAGLSVLIEDFQLRVRLSRNSNRFIRKHFSSKKCFQPLLEIIRTHS